MPIVAIRFRWLTVHVMLCSNQGGIASQLDGKQSVKLRERAEQAFEKVQPLPGSPSVLHAPLLYSSHTDLPQAPNVLLTELTLVFDEAAEQLLPLKCSSCGAD